MPVFCAPKLRLVQLWRKRRKLLAVADSIVIKFVRTGVKGAGVSEIKWGPGSSIAEVLEDDALWRTSKRLVYSGVRKKR